MLDINEVKQMKLPELQDFAAKIGVPKYRYMKKGELQELIIKSFVNKGETHENAEKTEPQAVIQAESKQAKPVTAKRRAQDHTESQDEHVENPAAPHKPLSDGQLKALRAQQEIARRRMEEQKRQQQQQAQTPEPQAQVPAQPHIQKNQAPRHNQTPQTGAAPQKTNYFSSDYEFEGRS